MDHKKVGKSSGKSSLPFGRSKSSPRPLVSKGKASPTPNSSRVKLVQGPLYSPVEGDPLLGIPDTLWFHIFRYLSVGTICFRCMTVCKKWRDILRKPSIVWRIVDLSKLSTRRRYSQGMLLARVQLILQQKKFKQMQLLKFPNMRYTSSGLYNILLMSQQLRAVDFTGCVKLEDKPFSVVLQLPVLEYINITDCFSLTDKSLAALKDNRRVTHIFFDNCIKFTEKAIFDLSRKCKNQTKSGVPSSGGSFFRLKKKSSTPSIPTSKGSSCTCPLGRLQLVSMMASRISTAGLEQLLSCSAEKLQVLQLSHTDAVTNSCLAKLGETKILRELRLDYCQQITNNCLHTFLRVDPAAQLRVLTVRGCEGLSDEFLTTLAGATSRLAFLDVSRCPKFSKAGLYPVLRNCRQLQKLNLKLFNDDLSDLFEECGPALGDLRYINLDEGKWVTDDFLARLVEVMTTLMVLKLSGTAVTKAALEILDLPRLPVLRRVELRGVPSIPPKLAKSLRKKRDNNVEVKLVYLPKSSAPYQELVQKRADGVKRKDKKKQKEGLALKKSGAGDDDDDVDKGNDEHE